MTSDTASQIAYLARALKAPALRDSAERLAATAREAGWTHQEYLAACLEAEAATRSAHGAANRIRAAGFPARKTIELSGVHFRPSVTSASVAWTAVFARRRVVIQGPTLTSVTSA